jgi:GxxExxY protein
MELVFKEETYKIRGACFEVYKDKGCGFVESVYQECLEIEFQLQGIPFSAQQRLNIDYKGHRLKSEFVPDLICYNKIIVELKAIASVTNQHRAQVHNYLSATGLKLGLLVNFGHHPKIEIERIIR